MSPIYQDESEVLLPTVTTQADNSNDVDAHVGVDCDDQKQKFKETAVQYIKYTYSLALLALCLRLILAGIMAGETPVAQAMNPMAALSIMLCLILWLAVLEGLQGCLVGLQPIDPQKYGRSHPVVLQCTTVAHYGDNLNRFIVGRQFWVVLIIFCLSLCCTLAENSAALVVSGVPAASVPILLSSGLAIMIVTVILGQLSAEVNATHSMLDYMNTPVMLVSTWLCLAIESSGLLHSVYLFQHFFEFLATKDGDHNQTSTSDMETITTEKPTPASITFAGKIFYWARVLFSFSILAYAMVVTVIALIHDETTMISYGIFSYAFVKILILVGLIFFLGILEAMQIALFAVVNLSPDLLESYPQAQANCTLVFSGNNFQGFLIGRQICVTMTMFLLARITTTDVQLDDNTDTTILHMGDSLQEFFNTGLPGALITTIVASLAFRILASCFPIPFMQSFCVYPTIRLCLVLEDSGVFSAAWVVAKMLQKAIGFQNDQVYLGAMGQRASTSAPSTNKRNDDDISATETAQYSSSSSDDDISQSQSGLTDNGCENNRGYGATV